jgi:D-glycero-D-manno-heptose 1,7-bisphosphate phosphatase
VVRNGKPYPPADLAEMVLTDGVEDACRRLKAAGLRLLCVTNQPDIATGKTTAATVEAINRRLETLLGLDATLVCPHVDADGCDCRKPAPGLLLAAAARWDVDLSLSVMVGDRWRDIEAGRRAGCRTVFIDYGYDERRPERPDLIAPSLAAAAPWILAGLPGF